jgi:hypothetical protein
VKLTGCRVNGYKIDPLVMQQVLQQRVLLDGGGYATRGSLDEREQAHWFVIVSGAIVDALQRQPRLKIAVTTMHHANT